MNIIVGMSDMKVSGNPEETLITYSLGSCIGVTLYDPRIKAGGVLHYMLPDSSLDTRKAQKKPCMFADTGIAALLEALGRYGAERRRLKVVIAGGAQMIDPKGLFNIGKKNYLAVKAQLEKNKVPIHFADVGGSQNRTISLEIRNGSTLIKVPGMELRSI